MVEPAERRGLTAACIEAVMKGEISSSEADAAACLRKELSVSPACSVAADTLFSGVSAITSSGFSRACAKSCANGMEKSGRWCSSPSSFLQFYDFWPPKLCCSNRDNLFEYCCEEEGLSGGAIAGIVIGILAAVVASVLGCYVNKCGCFSYRRNEGGAPQVGIAMNVAQPASQFTNIAQAPPQAVQMADAAKPDVVAVAVEGGGGGVPADIAALLNEAKIPVEKCGAALVDSGVEKAADLADLNDSDFADMGLSKLEIKRLRKAAEARAQ